MLKSLNKNGSPNGDRMSLRLINKIKAYKPVSSRPGGRDILEKKRGYSEMRNLLICFGSPNGDRMSLRLINKPKAYKPVSLA